MENENPLNGCEHLDRRVSCPRLASSILLNRLFEPCVIFVERRFDFKSIDRAAAATFFPALCSWSKYRSRLLRWSFYFFFISLLVSFLIFFLSFFNLRIRISSYRRISRERIFLISSNFFFSFDRICFCRDGHNYHGWVIFFLGIVFSFFFLET